MILGLLWSLPVFSNSSVKWVAFGDLRGHLEPCGCDPRTDLGGFQRLDAYFNRERSLHQDILLFHLGNAFPGPSEPMSSQKKMAIFDALKIVNPDGYLLNKTELLNLQYLPQGLPYVLSNYKKSELISKLGTKASIVIGDTIILGFVEPFKGFSQLESFDAKTYRDLIRSEKAKTKHSILLFSGETKTLAKIAALNLFDDIISSHPVDWEVLFGDEDRKDEKRLIVGKLKSGVDILATPLGGQGVIRSSSLQTVEPAKTVSEILKSKNSAELKRFIPVRTIVFWLTKSEEVGISTKMQELFKQYRTDSAGAMERFIAQKEKDLAKSSHVGAEVCKSCHAEAYTVWQQSKHAHAFETLKQGQRTSDPECVSCHVLAFDKKDGFISEALSPQFASVQCENCHGPRKKHTSDPANKTYHTSGKKPGTELCVTCHAPAHSPAYNFDAYWQRIKHK